MHDIEELPAGMKAIGSRQVYTTKLNKDGSIERYKARLVVKGYSQIAGVDYNETFAPVTRYDRLRLIISLTAHPDLRTSQLDIESAFTYGPCKNSCNPALREISYVGDVLDVIWGRTPFVSPLICYFGISTARAMGIYTYYHRNKASNSAQ